MFDQNTAKFMIVHKLESGRGIKVNFPEDVWDNQLNIPSTMYQWLIEHMSFKTNYDGFVLHDENAIAFMIKFNVTELGKIIRT